MIFRERVRTCLEFWFESRHSDAKRVLLKSRSIGVEACCLHVFGLVKIMFVIFQHFGSSSRSRQVLPSQRITIRDDRVSNYVANETSRHISEA